MRHYWYNEHALASWTVGSCCKPGIYAILMSGVFLVNLKSYALPFESSARGFESHLNQVKWGGEGKRVRFSDLSNCQYSTYLKKNYNDPRIQQAKDKAAQINWDLRVFLDSQPSKEQANEAQDKYLALYEYYQNTLPDQYATESGKTFENYACSGYATITDPRGTTVCQVYTYYEGQTNRYTYNPYGCRWQ